MPGAESIDFRSRSLLGRGAHMSGDDKPFWTTVDRGSSCPVVFLSLLICLSLIDSKVAHAQLAVLDDGSLSNVTALTRNDSRVRVSDPIPSNFDVSTDADSGGDENAFVSGVFVSGASAHLELRNEVRLADQSQSTLRAATIRNSSASDLVGGLNIFAMPADDARNFSSIIDVAQSNELTQTGSKWASLGYFATLSPSYRSSFLQTSSSNSSSEHSRRVESIDRQRSLLTTTTQFSATAIAEAPDLFDGLVIGDQDIGLEPFTIGPEPFTISVCGPLGNSCVDRQISPPNILVQGASINTGGVTFPGNQMDGHAIVLSAPVLTIPDLTLQVCLRFVAGCSDPSEFTSFTIPGRQIQLLDQFAGPVEGVTVFGQGLGLGYAIAGTGEIALEPGNISGAFHIDLNELIDNLSLTVPILGFEIPLSFLPFSLPTFDVPIDIDIPMNNADQFNVSIDNQACIVSNGDEVCTGLDETNVTITELALSEQGYIETEQTERTRSEAFMRTRSSLSEGEVSAQGAAAKIIVIDNSSVEAGAYNLVFFESDSQSGIRALNVENGAMGIFSTGLNVTGINTKVSKATGLSFYDVQQTNRISQIGGL